MPHFLSASRARRYYMKGALGAGSECQALRRLGERTTRLGHSGGDYRGRRERKLRRSDETNAIVAVGEFMADVRHHWAGDFSVDHRVQHHTSPRRRLFRRIVAYSRESASIWIHVGHRSNALRARNQPGGPGTRVRSDPGHYRVVRVTHTARGSSS